MDPQDRPPSRNRALVTRVDASGRDKDYFSSPVRPSTPLSTLLTANPTVTRHSSANGGASSGAGTNYVSPRPASEQSSAKTTDHRGPRFEVDEEECAALTLRERPLLDQIYMDGFLEGFFSDISVEVLGDVYFLHRIVLARGGWFRKMLATRYVRRVVVHICIWYLDYSAAGSRAVMCSSRWMTRISPRRRWRSFSPHCMAT